MRKVLIAAFGALILTTAFAGEASAQRWRYGYDGPYAYPNYGYAPVYSFGYLAPSASTGYPVPFGGYAYESCGTVPRLVWNGWAYRRVWVSAC